MPNIAQLRSEPDVISAARVRRADVTRAGDVWDFNQPFSCFFYGALRGIDLSVGLGLLCAALMAGNLNRMPAGVAEFLAIRITLKNLALIGLFAVTWYALLSAFQLYETDRPRRLTPELKILLRACCFGTAPALLIAACSVSGAFGVREAALFWMSATLALAGIRVSARALGNVLGPRLARRRNCLIVGSGPVAFKLYEALLASPAVVYNVAGFVDKPGAPLVAEAIRDRMLGNLTELRNILKNRAIDEVLIALPIKSCYAQIQDAIHVCEEAGVECKLPSDSFCYSIAKPRVERQHSRSVITLKVVRDDHTLLVKRVIDLTGAIAGAAALSPLMLAIAVAIRATSPGPAIFSQKRYGLNKRVFRMHKFRTMTLDAEQRQPQLEQLNEMNGPVFKIRNDPRVTSVGRFLRRTSLDELPQLWNVALGNMSLVGPRPLPLRDVARFSDASLMRRFSVKPGLTCLWQINGRSETSFDRWMELDLRYIDGWSLRLDLEILAKTLPVVVKGQGAV
jgi:exopolysaccharide biosynthesis polyprenyl glycosylphosphotransferase